MDAKAATTHKTRAFLTTVSAVVVAAFMLAGAVFTKQATGTFSDWLSSSLFALKWYNVGLVAFVLFFVLWLGFGRYKNVRLGRDTDVPEFRWLSWFSMLFAAGMGIGLIFWSVSEPLSHFQSNPFVEEGSTPRAASTALRLTFFHWGLHAWAVYALVGLCLAYFAFRRDLPLTIRSVLYPIFGHRIHGPIGHVADVFAVFGTTFGVATAITGGTGLYIELFGEGGLTAALERDVSLPLFETVRTLAPGIGGDMMVVLIMALTAIYFITSNDSGTLVITIAWGLGEGVIAGTLLSTGGLAALQSATIAAALPFSLIMLVMIFGLVKGLRDEPQAPREGVLARNACDPWTGCRACRDNDGNE